MQFPSRVRTLLVLGGARSGKSAFAERMILDTGCTPVYIATAEAGDAEMAARIAAHRGRRGPAWRTVEEPLDLIGCLEAEAGESKAVLVDCLTLWLSNLLGAGKDVPAATGELVAWLAIAKGPLVLVSNEVGSGVMPDNRLARQFSDLQGFLNQRVAAAVSDVTLMVAGLPLAVKRREG